MEDLKDFEKKIDWEFVVCVKGNIVLLMFDEFKCLVFEEVFVGGEGKGG